MFGCVNTEAAIVNNNCFVEKRVDWAGLCLFIGLRLVVVLLRRKDNKWVG